jgi:hypothetical protein
VWREMIVGPNAHDDASEAKNFSHCQQPILYDVICIFKLISRQECKAANFVRTNP